MSNASPADNNNPQLSGGLEANQPSPGKKKSGKIAEKLVLVVLLGVLAVVLLWRYDDISDMMGWKIAGEQEASAKLTERRLLVISEGPDKKVTSISYCDMKNSEPVVPDEEILIATAKLYRLGTLNASACKITDDQLRYFSGLRNLTSLVLDGTPITDAGLAHLRGLKSLESFLLPNTAVTDKGLEHIAKNTNLKILDLSKTKVTDKGLVQLQSLPSLNWLLLSDTEISDAGLEHLTSIKTLGRLTMFKTKITPKGIAKLQSAIPGLKIEN